MFSYSFFFTLYFDLIGFNATFNISLNLGVYCLRSCVCDRACEQAEFGQSCFFKNKGALPYVLLQFWSGTTHRSLKHG